MIAEQIRSLLRNEFEFKSGTMAAEEIGINKSSYYRFMSGRMVSAHTLLTIISYLAERGYIYISNGI